MDVATVETVLGPTKLSQLGRTLTHEHLALDFNKFYVPPPSQLENYFITKIHLENVGYIKQYPYSSRYNIIFNDKDTETAVIKDVKLFKYFGGGTIVDNTNFGIRRNIPSMKRISEATGVNIIVGTGHYVEATQDVNNLQLNEESMYNLMLKELIEGCVDYSDIKAGFIGEVGSSWPITDFEKRAIRATAQVQSQLNCPVSFHPGRDSRAPYEITRIFREAGGNTEKMIMSHLDRTLTDKEKLLTFADEKCYCQFDLFGIECSYYQLNQTTDMPSDAQRLDMMKWIKDDGKMSQILMSHDIHTKHRLVEFGGHGYSHILNNILPRMSTKGFTSEDIDIITINNPRTWLS